MIDGPYARIQRNALRLARLAALSAPAVILAKQADKLDDAVTLHCQAMDVDRAEWRARRVADDIAAMAADEPLTAEEEAQLEAEEKAYEIAERKAQAASGHPDAIWLQLDTSYRFGLIMAQYEEPVAPAVSEGQA